VLDLGMPGMSSFDAGRIIHQRCAGTRVVYLTAHNGREYVLEGLRSGATGYLLKDISASGLRQALRDIHRGIRTLSPELVAKLAEDPESRPFAPRASSRTTLLTAREREVMKLLAEGHTARQISVLLGVSTKTVEAHRFNLMRKLGIHNKAQLVTAAIQKRIVTPPLPF
jgi:DNA-binding NarL/FixJ family response regulator